jgi:hypothetical protein
MPRYWNDKAQQHDESNPQKANVAPVKVEEMPPVPEAFIRWLRGLPIPDCTGKGITAIGPDDALKQYAFQHGYLNLKALIINSWMRQTQPKDDTSFIVPHKPTDKD